MATQLPEGFTWGYATGEPQRTYAEEASQQIEGAACRGESIWDRFANTQSQKIADRSDSNKTCDSYHLWREDVALLKEYGCNAYRFSIAWPRVIPKGGRREEISAAGLQYYNDLIDELLRVGITPWVTLYHWDLPQALEDSYGGWLNKDEILQDFAHYAGVCFAAFGDRVKNWITINETYVITIPGWFNGDCAPGRSSDRRVSERGDSDTEPWIVGHNLMLAHATASKLFKREYAPRQGGSISITLNGDWAEPWDASDPESVAATERKMAAAIDWFADPIFLGKESQIMRHMLGDRLPKFSEEEWALLKDSSDYYGCNTYTTNYIKAGGSDVSTGNGILCFENSTGKSIGTPGACSWLVVCPWGFRKHLNYLYQKYQKPIMVTEAGYARKHEDRMPLAEALHDLERAQYHTQYLDNLLAAVVEDGVDVRSYFGWTLMDNWEWAEGYIPRFGVTHVDFRSGKRTPKSSARAITKWFETRTQSRYPNGGKRNQQPFVVVKEESTFAPA